MPVGKAGEIRGFASVGHYIQGPGAIRLLPQIIERFGKDAAVLLGHHFQKEQAGCIRELLEKGEVRTWYPEFEGSCSEEEIAHLKECFLQRSCKPEIVVGIGGGKLLDTVRVLAVQLRLAMILVPTSVASNAATSGLSVIYDWQRMGKTVFLYRNPDYVIADTDYIIQAPPRMLAAGIGDALSTYFEARSNWLTGNINTVMPGYRPTICGKKIAESCLSTLLEHGEKACRDAERSLRTEDFEDTVEAINLLSGIGWENNGCSITHALASALSAVEETRSRLHGECVAFCLLVQLILDGERAARFEQIRGLCSAIGLPTRLAELGITENAEEKVRRIVERAFAAKGTLMVADYEMTPEKLYNAIMFVDRLSKV